MDAPDRIIDAEEYATIPDVSCRHALVAGYVVAEPFPAPVHDLVRGRIERLLHAYVSDRGLGKVFCDVGYLLAEKPDTVRGPDVSFVAKARLTGIDLRRWLRGAPDLAIEVLSPSNRRGEVHAKIADYLAGGARVCWVIDPARRRVAVYRRLLFPTHLSADDVLDGGEVLPGFEVQVASLFDELS
ncbi:MAG TPA: Uma2 family endonuclease [Candidatus Polarisedimenticolaceae bacterium]|nr:Uma2 family endonuclease [Candidatus Polarisedimenticolaceae bacterium]